MIGLNDNLGGAARPSGASGSSPGSYYAPPSVLEREQLVSLFHQWGGFVPGFEFEAEGFKLADLLERGLIARPTSHLDAGCYLIGEALRRAVQKV